MVCTVSHRKTSRELSVSKEQNHRILLTHNVSEQTYNQESNMPVRLNSKREKMFYLDVDYNMQAGLMRGD